MRDRENARKVVTRYGDAVKQANTKRKAAKHERRQIQLMGRRLAYIAETERKSAAAGYLSTDSNARAVGIEI